MRLLSSMLLRAPLLPVSALSSVDPLATPLGEEALRRASASLGRGHRNARARRNYARRAAFRATPHGLLAGVTMATVAERSKVALGEPRAHCVPSFAELSAIGRELLGEQQGFRAARVRVAPSLLRDAERASWMCFGEHEAQRREILLDELIAHVLELAAEWIDATRLAEAIGSDELILQLVDDGLLHHDLEPPLVGRAPPQWARERLLPLRPDLVLDDGSHATLLHTAGSTIARAPLERAAACAPLLFALGEALNAPTKEVVPGLDDAMEAAGALVGEGLYPLAPLQLGHYGVRIEGETPSTTPDASIVAQLTTLVIAAARDRRDEVALDALALVPTNPPTFELQLTPRDVDDRWLLGVHAPAGSTWGRFAAALGQPMLDALDELADAESMIDGDVVRLDVAYAPSRALADLCQVPSLREATLAISSWPEEGAVVPEQCAIVRDPVSDADGAFSAAGHALAIAPLHRVRSTTAPPSVERALLADTLVRQHAPWALTWGPLATQPWLPRATLRGFVIAPQSWLLPSDRSCASLKAWRKDLPRHVQVGHEDALLPIDLDDADDRETLRGLSATRAFEIWPPLGDELDRGGRRIELVCAVVDDAQAEAIAKRAARIESLAIAPPPSSGIADPTWQTVRIYAPRDRHAQLLVEIIAPFAKTADAWFFLPYVDPPARPHLRARFRNAELAPLMKMLDEAIACGEIAAVERAAYHAEHARFGDALPQVERIFQSESELIVALATDEPTLPDEALLAVAFDALADGLGLSQELRLARCEDALAAYAVAIEEEREQLAPAFRAIQQPLLALMEAPDKPFITHARRVRATKLRRGEALLPTLLHLCSVRMCGADRDAEVRALYLWKRALRSRRARS